MTLSQVQEDQGQVAINTILSSSISHRRKIQALNLIEPGIRELYKLGLTRGKPTNEMTDDDLTH